MSREDTPDPSGIGDAADEYVHWLQRQQRLDRMPSDPQGAINRLSAQGQDTIPTIPPRRNRNSIIGTLGRAVDHPLTMAGAFGTLGGLVSLPIDILFLNGFGLAQVGPGGCAGITVLAAGAVGFLISKVLKR